MCKISEHFIICEVSKWPLKIHSSKRSSPFARAIKLPLAAAAPSERPNFFLNSPPLLYSPWFCFHSPHYFIYKLNKYVLIKRYRKKAGSLKFYVTSKKAALSGDPFFASSCGGLFVPPAQIPKCFKFLTFNFTVATRRSISANSRFSSSSFFLNICLKSSISLVVMNRFHLNKFWKIPLSHDHFYDSITVIMTHCKSSQITFKRQFTRFCACSV